MSTGRLARPWTNMLRFSVDRQDPHRSLTLLTTTLASAGLSIAPALSVYGAVGVLTRTALGAVAGRWLNVHLRLTAGQRLALIAVAVVLTILLEIRQQVRSDLLATVPHGVRPHLRQSSQLIGFSGA